MGAPGGAVFQVDFLSPLFYRAGSLKMAGKRSEAPRLEVQQVEQQVGLLLIPWPTL